MRIAALFCVLALTLMACTASGQVGQAIEQRPTTASRRTVEVYVVVPEATPDQASLILAVEKGLSKVDLIYQAHYQPSVVLSPDRRVLYVLDTSWPQRTAGDAVHTLTALSARTGVGLWDLTLPGPRNPYMLLPNEGIWTSTDGRRIYIVMGAADHLSPRLVVVDAATRKVINEWRISLPRDPRLHFPWFWKLAWSDELVIVSGEWLFTVDLNSGVQSKGIRLPGFAPDDRLRIPRNLNQELSVEGGDIAARVKRLYLVTSAQDVLVIELDNRLTAQRAFTLPLGWQVGINTPPLVTADGHLAYLGVRPNDAPLIHGARVPEAVWVYRTADWQRLGIMRPGEGSAQALGIVDIALSSDERTLYVISRREARLFAIDTQTMRMVADSVPLRERDTGQPMWGTIIVP